MQDSGPLMMMSTFNDGEALGPSTAGLSLAKTPGSLPFYKQES
jgi:hypothetical protein